MADKKEPDQKQGLHGWKAAAAVFGCGSLAAFGVFGVVVTVLGGFLSTLSSGVDRSSGTEAPVEQIGEARSSLDVGQMDICSDNIDPLTTIQTSRLDDGSNHIDTAADGEPEIDGASRVISDECSWTLTPEGGSSPWDFSFEYEAIIDASDGETREEIASSRFDEVRTNLSSSLSEVESEGDADLGANSYSAYGVGDQGQSVYIAVFLTKSAVYQIRFDDQVETSVGVVSENAFRNEARKISSFLGDGFQYWIPDN